jgi:hypothetical protein
VFPLERLGFRTAAFCRWFTEGFDTADLKDAKALLEEFGGVNSSSKV